MAGFINNTLIGKQAAAFLFKEQSLVDSKVTIVGSGAGKISNDDVLVFQYWPTQIQDTYEVEYATKSIPGGSHPLYQWIGGTNRAIAFDALFTSEVDDPVSTLPGIFLDELLPSHRYTVDVAGALARLRTFQLPKYTGGKRGSAVPPPRLRLFLPETSIGGNTHSILCFLKSMRITYESHFPSGKLRVATAALEFLETVQQVATGSDTSAIQFIGSESFAIKAQDYRYTPV